MRLTENDIKSIKKAIVRHFGKDAVVVLFGSRVDDKKRGGDIDLLVESIMDEETLFLKKLDALGEMKMLLGERKIDLVAYNPESGGEIPLVVREARNTGIHL